MAEQIDRGLTQEAKWFTNAIEDGWAGGFEHSLAQATVEDGVHEAFAAAYNVQPNEKNKRGGIPLTSSHCGGQSPLYSNFAAAKCFL